MALELLSQPQMPEWGGPASAPFQPWRCSGRAVRVMPTVAPISADFAALTLDIRRIYTPHITLEMEAALVKAFHIFALMLVAIAMALSLAHALELPGKLRLPKQNYLAVQTIYYPGFTWGGFAEIGGLLALAVLLFLFPVGGAKFWVTVAALVLLGRLPPDILAGYASGERISGSRTSSFPRWAGCSSLSFAASSDADWTRLRDIWEYSHVTRACFTVLGLLATSIALAM